MNTFNIVRHGIPANLNEYIESARKRFARIGIKQESCTVEHEVVHGVMPIRPPRITFNNVTDTIQTEVSDEGAKQLHDRYASIGLYIQTWVQSSTGIRAVDVVDTYQGE